jgi:CubicO group peptidase (beta-lactamase class C family)
MILQSFRDSLKVHRLRISVAVVIAAIALTPSSEAQGLATGLFARYVDGLRQDLGIPGLSAAIVQDGAIVWDAGFGHQNVAQAVPATRDTPYPLLNISEIVGSAVLLQQCVDFGDAELSDRVIRWTPNFPEQSATLAQVLGHVSASGTYQYDSARFGRMSEVTRECVKQPYARVLATQVLERFAMTRSVPGREVTALPASAQFSASSVSAYSNIVQQMALPYRVDSSKRATRSDYTPPPLSASTGLIVSAYDLAKFDAALGDGVLISSGLLAQSWQQGANRPTGLGWFVSSYNNEKVVWQFGVARDAYSSLIVKVPGRRLTLVLLANSDALGSSLSTSQPDVNQSIFAKLFLKLFVG